MAPEPDNSAAGEAIASKLCQVTEMAESVDSALRDAGLLCESDSADLQHSMTSNIDGDEDVVKCQSESESAVRCSSDQESVVTAPLWNPTSRSSSYQTASECRSSPWWESEKNSASDLEAEVDVPRGILRIRPAGASSSTSTSFDESDHSLMSTSFRSTGSSKNHSKTPSLDDDGDEGSSSSTISQGSRKQSVIHEEDLIGKLSLETPSPQPALIEILPLPATVKVSTDHESQPDFMAWNRYYQSLINKQTLRSCL